VIYVFRYVVLILATLFWGAVGCVVSLFDRSGEAAVWAARNWARWLLAAPRVEVECSGLERIDFSRPYVFMSNHQSVFDVPAIVSTLPVSFRFVAKRELTWIPVFGWALVLARHIIIDRSRRQHCVHSLGRAAEQIRCGTNVIIFPEGTRSETDSLGAFKSGGFHLALRAGVPVLPISVSGSRRIAPKKSLRIESGRIRVHYGQPVPTAGLSLDDREALKEKVREVILAGFDPAFPDVPDRAA
jgi:1-acyl-sn-glycerol-3-phosphate acyltransferase